MKIRGITLFLILSFYALFSGYAQEKIQLSVKDKPLNKFLIGLRDSFHVNISFNDELLSRYTVNIDGTYNNIPQVIKSAIKNKPFQLEQLGSIYIIATQKKSPFKTEAHEVLMDGLVADQLTGEILPYSTVIINTMFLVTDFRGRFSYKADFSDTLHVNVKHIGYHVFDTIIGPVVQITCQLKPNNLELNEVLVQAAPIEYATQTGKDVGEVRLNQKMAGFIPGGLNNSVYNILRLQPGIKGSSEHVQYLSVWGSRYGQNQTRFDGITIYNLNSFSDYFNSVNPLLIKDMNIYKGGFGSSHGNRVGSIIDINGVDGNYHKPEVELYMDNLSLNGMVSVPLFKRSTLVVAHRRSLLNAFNRDMVFKMADFSPDDFADIYYIPDNTFQDLNAKFSSFLSNGDQFFISAFNSRATSSLGFIEPLDNRYSFYVNKSQTMRQTGVSAYYGKLWKSGIGSNLKMTYSGFSTHGLNELARFQEDESLIDVPSDLNSNRIDEIGLAFDNRYSLTKAQFVEAGIEFNHYATNLDYTIPEYLGIFSANRLNKASVYVRNNIQASDILKMDIGLRLDYNLMNQTLLFQPRIRSSVNLWKDLMLNLTWGVYNQIISVISIFDPDGNERYLWQVPDSENAPVLQSDIVGAGLSWSGSSFLINAEGYYRRTEGLQRYYMYPSFNDYLTGLSHSYGADVFIKKDFNHHTVWASYSYSHSEEHFSDDFSDVFETSRNNLGHEIKAAAIINFNPVFASFNYVFGSGFNPVLSRNIDQEKPYSRIDGSVYYKLEVKKWKVRVGLNAVNLTNRKNFPYLSQHYFEPENDMTYVYSRNFQPFYALFFIDLSF